MSMKNLLQAMQTNIFSAFLTIFLLFGGLSSAFAQDDIVELRFETQVNCQQSTYTAVLQMRAKSDTFKIGTSSIFFTYNKAALSFTHYESMTFDGSHNCVLNVAKAWDSHAYDASVSGAFNLTINLNLEEWSCPTIENEWIDLGVLSFDIIDNHLTSNLQINEENTNFNRNIPNDGTESPTKGLFEGKDESLACNGCNAPELKNDEFTFNCPALSFSENILSNDIATNPSISIVSNPAKGTVNVDNNGQFTYLPTAAFCGTDQFEYQVCTDGNSDCCSTATVVLHIQDTNPPVFAISPQDITLSCSNVPMMDSLDVQDNCGALTIVHEQRIVAGDCPVKDIITRTWTATDACGNSTVVSQQITVVDEMPPSIECPDDLTLNCGESILPDANESKATASDSCSIVDITFEDDTSLPNNCSFDQVVIKRTWTAADVCGNTSTCVQIITVNGNPCPQPTTKELSIYACSGDTIDLINIFNISPSANYTLFDRNTENPIDNPSHFLVPIPGCQQGFSEISLKVHDDADCLIEHSFLSIIIIPEIYADIQSVNEGCGASLLMECPDLYAISWSDSGGNQGEGKQYIASQALREKSLLY